MFQLRRIVDADNDQVLALRVHPDQSPFVEPIAETLDAETPSRDNHVIVSDDVIVGFFQIDTGNFRRFEDSPALELELHEVIVDVSSQGQGIGRGFISALPDFLRDSYADWPCIALTVNCRNERAHTFYAKGGFADTGEVFAPGRSGPQHVMRMWLR